MFVIFQVGFPLLKEGVFCGSRFSFTPSSAAPRNGRSEAHWMSRKAKVEPRDRSRDHESDALNMTRESYLNYPGYHDFSLQSDAEAMAFSRGCSVWSYDKDADKASKRFVATGALTLWRKIKDRPGELRNSYEMLATHRLTKLFFDIEYYPLVNLDSQWTFEERMEMIKNIVKDMLRRLYGLEVRSIVELDSSNEQKFSRHLIVKIAGYRFKNAAHCGAFMRRVAHQAYADFNGKVGNPFFQWGENTTDKSDPTQMELVIDKGVYTRMRSFRLPYNTKRKGVPRFLVPVGHAKLNPDDRYKIPADGDAVFLRSLIQLPPKRAVESIEATEPNNEPARWTSDDPFKNMSRGSTVKIPRLDHDGTAGDGSAPKVRSKERRFRRNGVEMYRDPEGVLYQVNEEELIPMMCENLSDSQTAGTLPQAGEFKHFCRRLADKIAETLDTTVKYRWPFESSMILSFQLNSKYCETAQREHHSNHMKVVVLLAPRNSGFVRELGGDVSYTPLMYYRCYVCEPTKPKPIPFFDDAWQSELDLLVLKWQGDNTVACFDLFKKLVPPPVSK